MKHLFINLTVTHINILTEEIVCTVESSQNGRLMKFHLESAKTKIYQLFEYPIVKLSHLPPK